MGQSDKRELSQRIVDWALKDAEREFMSGFPLLRQIDTNPAKKYILYLSALPEKRALAASRGLVRRMNEPMLLRRQAQLTELEAALVADFLGDAEGLGAQISENLEAAVDSSSVKRTREMRRVLRRILTEKLEAVCGPSQRMSSNQWIHSKNLGFVTIDTWIDVGGLSALRYSHSIHATDGSRIATHLSILQWLGATSATRWEFLKAEQIPSAVDALGCVTGHFLQAMETLFA